VLGYQTSSKSSTLPAATTRSSAAKSSTSTQAKTTAASTRSATGSDVPFQYGDLQLKVTMSGSRITDVSVVQMNSNDPHSESIDAAALPELRQEAISAQSAKIDGVSGASYTSEAYRESLQAAVDKLS
jgi:uncharacterized protein with FMN-binding domain